MAGVDSARGLRCGYSMHFTIERARLLALARVARIGAIGPRRRECKVFLWACAARVFLQVNGTVAG